MAPGTEAPGFLHASYGPLFSLMAPPRPFWQFRIAFRIRDNAGTGAARRSQEKPAGGARRSQESQSPLEGFQDTARAGGLFLPPPGLLAPTGSTLASPGWTATDEKLSWSVMVPDGPLWTLLDSYGPSWTRKLRSVSGPPKSPSKALAGSLTSSPKST
jgi:hypothetical protein